MNLLASTSSALRRNSFSLDFLASFHITFATKLPPLQPSVRACGMYGRMTTRLNVTTLGRMFLIPQIKFNSPHVVIPSALCQIQMTQKPSSRPRRSIHLSFILQYGCLAGRRDHEPFFPTVPTGTDDALAYLAGRDTWIWTWTDRTCGSGTYSIRFPQNVVFQGHRTQEGRQAGSIAKYLVGHQVG